MYKQHLKTKSLTYFSHWSRKSYSVFNSLNRIIKICFLLVSVVVLISPGEINAQADTTHSPLTDCYLEETEVVAQRSEVINGRLAKIVTIITREEIAAGAARDLQDVLSIVANVDIRSRGRNDIQADISLRGGTFDQTLILLNGIPINDPQTGHHNLNLPVDLNQIERIEILYGPGSRANGPNAYSGAVNFVTRQGNKNQVEASLLCGENGLYKIGAGVTLKKKNRYHFVSVNHDKSDGYINNTDFVRYNAFYAGGLDFESSTFNWQTGYTVKSFGANSFYTPAYPNQFEQTRSLFGSIKHKIRFSDVGIKTSVYYRGHTDRFELFRDGIDAASWYSNHNYHWTNTSGINSNISYYSVAGIFSFGYDYRFENILSNVLGELTGDTIPAIIDNEGFYSKKTKRSNSGFYFEHVYQKGEFRVVSGLAANLNSRYEDNIGWNPGVDLSYSRNNIQFTAGINKSMRIPTFTDLYYQGLVNIGNPDLLPEENICYEIGLGYSISNFKFNVSVFHSQGKNIIDWVRELDSEKWQPMNHTRINNSGIELAIKSNPFFLLRDDLYIIKSLKMSYSYNDLTKNSKEYISKYVMDYMKHKLSFQLNHLVVKNLYGSWTWIWQDRAGTYTFYDISSSSYHDEVEYPHFNLLDFRLYWKYKQWYVFSDVSNVFNVDYVDIGNVNQPGRWMSLGVIYKLDLDSD